MNKQRPATKLPYYLFVVGLLALAACTNIRAATRETGPVFPTTTASAPWPTSTAAPSPTPTPLRTTTPSLPTPTPLPTFSAPAAPAMPTASPGPAGQTGLPVERRLLVSQDEQMLFVFENEVAVRTIPVSTGAPVTNTFTPPWEGTVGDDWGSGPFRNRQLADYKWYLFPGPEGSILIHSVPYTVTNGLKVYDRPEALGVEPVSNGCVRISPEDAVWLKTWDPVGVPLTITRWSGKIQPAELTGVEVIGEEGNHE